MRKYLIFVVIGFFTGCRSQINKSKSGLVIINFQMLDAATHSKPVLWDSTRIWYKDGMAIEEIRTIQIRDDSLRRPVVRSVIDHYVFIDPGTKSCYYYKTFSDTAHIVKKREGLDSFTKDGGWNFYKDRNFEYEGEPVTMPDTEINKINYKRVKFQTKKGKTDYTSIGLFRCDGIGFLFKLDKAYSERIGCPMVRMDETPVGKGNSMWSEISFAAGSLTPEELKIFASWKKNEKL